MDLTSVVTFGGVKVATIPALISSLYIDRGVPENLWFPWPVGQHESTIIHCL
jgi:hypothetical protein